MIPKMKIEVGENDVHGDEQLYDTKPEQATITRVAKPKQMMMTSGNKDVGQFIVERI